MMPYDVISFQSPMEETTTSTETLPLGESLLFDLLAEILCRLPVKSLLQFHCVCKSWNSLISNDPKFIKKHLRMMSTTKRQHLVTTTWMMAKELTVMSYPFDSLQLASIFTSNPTQLDYSPIIISWRDGLIASCDGLLCFVIDQHLAVLYNPCLRKVKKLPSLDLPREEGSNLFAFGYDPFIDNYKVVSVFCYGRKCNVACKTQVKVHTLGTDSWRTIKDFPSKFRCDRHGVFVSGTVNWLTYCNSSRDLCAIVSLHLGNESFTDVWLMKEYGNKDSWIKLIRLPSNCLC